MDFLEEATNRGFIAQCTDEVGLREAMKDQIEAYIGFDATADCLHVGSLVQIMMLRLFQRHGHKAHLVIGGATTRIGDPSFRDSARPTISAEQIRKNEVGITLVFDQFFNNIYNVPPKHNNLDWMEKLNYLDVLSDVASHFSVNRMLSFDSVKNRLDREQGLSLLEFNYALMQSYDFWHLTTHNPNLILQMGGSDQWGNIVSGIELIKKREHKTVFGLTSPLITTSNGEKMGKSVDGAIWLSPKKLSSFDYWQFWRNTSDADVGKFLRLFTEIHLNVIEELEQLKGSDLNAAKIILANEATSIAHGVNAAQDAADAAREQFHGNKSAKNLPVFEVDDLKSAGVELPVLIVNVGFADSKSSARRLIREGGIKINDETVLDEKLIVADSIKLSFGKKRHILIKDINSND